jgi:hypothetical protein
MTHRTRRDRKQTATVTVDDHDLEVADHGAGVPDRNRLHGGG